MAGYPNYVADGNIYPSRFVTAASGSNRVVQADDGSGSTGDVVMGISFQGTRSAPLSGLQSPYAAIQGDNILVYLEEEVCYLAINATVAFGQRLKSDANGMGIVASADHDNIGAVAQESGVAGDLIKVQVRIGSVST